MSLFNALRGISGEFELNRVVGAFGAMGYTITANALVAFDVIWRGREFDITAYCLAFPAGLGVAVGAIAGAVAWKDRKVAQARVESAHADAADAANVQPVGGPQ